MNSCSQDESTSNMYINEMPRFYGAKNIARRNGGISFNTYVPDELRYLPHDSNEPKNVSHMLIMITIKIANTMLHMHLIMK